MTDKDKIRRAMTWAVKQCYGGFIYEKWDHESRLETVKNSREEFLKYIKEHLDWNDIDKETCKLLGFGRWSDDMPDLWLIPGYLYPIIPIGLKVKSISGDESTWTGKEDNDVRFGCLAYGIIESSTEDKNVGNK